MPQQEFFHHNYYREKQAEEARRKAEQQPPQQEADPRAAVDPNDPHTQEQLERLKELANHYGQAGEQQLIRDIFQNVIAQKANGTLDNGQLKAFVRQVSPLLTQEQRERLNGLVEELLKL